MGRERGDKTMNIGQLIAELSEYDREIPVKIHGAGDILDVEIDDESNLIIIGEHDDIS